ncbi:MAG: cache domain-containing protein [Burkholderiales bacterium]|nr:cache domain-containing protein [Burkholderiales bacterium]
MQIYAPLKTLFIAATASFIMAGGALAADQGSAAEAEAMAKKAVAFIKVNGPEKAADEFTNGKSFKDRDLYISYLDFTGKMLGHGSNAKLVGKDLIDLKDPEGKFMVKMAIEVAKTKGHGWTENYKFKNPTTDKLQEKAMYVERVGDAYVGVGIYK